MKKHMKLAVITTLMVIGMAAANAQTTITNVVLNLNVALSGFRQADESNAAPVRVTNKDIFNATPEGGAIGKTGKLIAVTTVDNGDEPLFFIRERAGVDVVDTPLEGMEISTGDEIVGAKGARYTILTLEFDNGEGTDFSVSGFATLRQGSVSGRGTGTVPDQTTSVVATVSGTGHINGEFVVLKGTVTGSGAKAEAVEIP